MHFTTVGTTFVVSLSLLSSIHAFPLAAPAPQNDNDNDNALEARNPIPLLNGISDAMPLPIPDYNRDKNGGLPSKPAKPSSSAKPTKPGQNDKKKDQICSFYFGQTVCRPRPVPSAGAAKREALDKREPTATLVERKLITDDDIAPPRYGRVCKGKVENCSPGSRKRPAVPTAKPFAQKGPLDADLMQVAGSGQDQGQKLTQRRDTVDNDDGDDTSDLAEQ